MQAKLRNTDTILESFLNIDNIQGNNESYKTMSDFIKGKNDITITDAKQTLHNVMSLNVDYHIIIKNIMKFLKIEKMKPEKICEIHEAISEADIMCVNGSKIVICLEYLIFKLKNIINS
jgi:predicted GTPase